MNARRLVVISTVLLGGDDDRFECGKGEQPARKPGLSERLGDYECAEPVTCSGGGFARVMSCKTPKWVCG